jgi:hypothetical protein
MKTKSRLLLLVGILATIVLLAIYSIRSNVTTETLVGLWKADASSPGTSIEFFADGKFRTLNFPLDKISRLSSKAEKFGIWNLDEEDKNIVRLDLASETVHSVVSRWRRGILTAYVGDPDAPNIVVFEKQE